jgi:endoglycosylceramidase
MRRLGTLVAVGVLAVSAIGWGTGAPEAKVAKANQGPVAPLGDQGRWLVDGKGRVVTLHGVNEVFKSPPHYPAADGFGADDAELLAENGFTTVRLGVVFGALMPEPGRIDPTYIEGLARTVEDLARKRIFVLLDFHQDGYGPKYNGNGFPDWMGIDDGLPNPPAEFPLYYVQNPAMQRAFESFWQNRSAVDGKGLQDHFVDGLSAVVKRFKGEPYVMGYELMNEPWPGAVWQPCVTGPAGCPDIEQSSLAPFYEKATTAVRKVTRKQPVYVEPFVLFNFGQTQTSLPGADTRNVLSFHSYALDPASEQAVVDNAVAAAKRDEAPLVATEFGATMDVPTLQRLTGQMDTGIVSWMFWAYNENIVTDRDEPASLDTVRDVEVFKALVRPYPLAVTGTPTSTTFDPATRVYDLTYSTRRPDGRRFRARGNVDTLVEVPALQYPDGYTVEVTGARVTSEPCAPLLTLRTTSRSVDAITVHITPGGRCS